MRVCEAGNVGLSKIPLRWYQFDLSCCLLRKIQPEAPRLFGLLNRSYVVDLTSDVLPGTVKDLKEAVARKLPGGARILSVARTRQDIESGLSSLSDEEPYGLLQKEGIPTLTKVVS